MKKYILISILSLLVLLVVAYFIADEPLPQGKKGPEADALAEKMLEAINHKAWEETVAVQWTFPGGHEHLWDKERQLARVSFDEYEALIRLDSVSGLVFRNGERISDTEREAELLREAWEYWVNDSFWLNAPNKVFDPGVERQVVIMEDGEEALLVTYTSGGATPGDSYLWLLDESGLPSAWKLWVSIIPLGGVEFSWSDWQTLYSGARVASHHAGPIDIRLEDIRASSSVEDLAGEDPFKPLF
ncbi:MAG: hypothetical protein ACLFUB_13295 [Cyclobacteriaceae bacterium]